VPALGEFLLGDEVAVRQEERARLLLGPDRHAILRHHVGPVGEIGDPPEPLGLALGGVDAAGAVEALQARVVLRGDLRDDGEFEVVGHVGDGQRLVADHVVRLLQRTSVERDRDELHVLAIQDQRALLVLLVRWIAPERGLRGDACRLRFEIEREVDRLDEEVRRAIVRETDRLRRFGSHRSPPVGVLLERFEAKVTLMVGGPKGLCWTSGRSGAAIPAAPLRPASPFWNVRRSKRVPDRRLTNRARRESTVRTNISEPLWRPPRAADTIQAQYFTADRQTARNPLTQRCSQRTFFLSDAHIDRQG